MTYITIQNNTINALGNTFPIRKISSVILGAIVMFALLYVYLVASTTMNVTMRKTLETQSREMQSQIADLEATYLSERSELTIGEAYTRGFTEDNHQIFVYRYATSESLALRSE